MKPSIHRRVIVIDRDSRMLFSIRMHRSLSLREREKERGKKEKEKRKGEGEGKAQKPEKGAEGRK